MNMEIIEQIVALVSANPISEITLSQEGQRVHVRKSASAPAHPPTAPASAPHTPAETEEPDAAAPIEPEEMEPLLLTAPMVGLFHHSRQPIRYGKVVVPGEVVGSIESMKLMNDVPAEQGGRVVEVLVEDGGPVEYGQALFRLVPA